MLFTSYSFILFIIIVFALYYIIPKKFQWSLLLAASYIFYFIAGHDYIIYIAVTTISTYLAGIGIDKLKVHQNGYIKEHRADLSKDEKKQFKAAIKKRQKRFLLCCVILNIGVLAVLKYTNFAINNINSLIKIFDDTSNISFMDLALPMGISFYTFQSMGYIIDIYRGKYSAERNLFKFALFVSFFPQLVQGPISRFDDLSATLFKQHSFAIKTVSYGLQRIIWGYFKKLVIADRILVAVNTIINDPNEFQGLYVFVGMLFYALELYADFTGGIDITIGIAEVLGIKVTENFNRPYFSKSIKEYWRRWHITMGTWFTDYIFYPISVCKGMLKLSKYSRNRFGEAIGKRIPIYLSSFVVWFTTGIWHGASWNFIVWGIMNWVVIMISQEFMPLYDKFHDRFNVSGKLYFRVFQVIRTVLLMSSLRLFDCYRDVPLTFKMFGNMFINFNLSELINGGLMNLGLTVADYIILLAGLIILVTVSYIQRKQSVREVIWSKPLVFRYGLIYILLLVIILLGAYGIGYDSAQFIYNQF